MKERMSVYNKIFSITTAMTSESDWTDINESLYTFFLQKQKAFITLWQKRLSGLIGLPFLKTLNQGWECIQVYLRWSTTIL